jgi:hypothetical protein
MTDVPGPAAEIDSGVKFAGAVVVDRQLDLAARVFVPICLVSQRRHLTAPICFTYLFDPFLFAK